MQSPQQIAWHVGTAQYMRALILMTRYKVAILYTFLVVLTGTK